MKILYLVHQFMPEFCSGTEKFIYNVASMSQKAGHQVKIITYSFYDKRQYGYKIGSIHCKDYIYDGIPVTALSHTSFPTDEHFSLSNHEVALAAKEILEKENPDVVHVGHAMRVAELVKQLPSLGIPYILTLTDYFLICPKVNLSATRSPLCQAPQGLASCRRLCPDIELEYLKKRRSTAASILANAAEITAPSNFIAGVFRAEIDGLKISVIPHGLSFKYIQRNHKPNSNDDHIVFGYAGSLTPHKGVHLLIEAFTKLPHSNIELKIFGDSSDNRYNTLLKANASPDSRIAFCGSYSPSDIGKIMQDIHVMIIPSICYESFSFILHEAIACEVPVIAADLGALPEKLNHKLSGMLFEPGNSISLYNMLAEICANRNLIDLFKKAIRSIEVTKIEQEAHMYERIYKKVTAATPRTTYQDI